jgi:hypothetical protein
MSDDQAIQASSPFAAVAGTTAGSAEVKPVLISDAGREVGLPDDSRLDRWTEWCGERINPILIKEARQALKSHHFITTFMLLLIAAWGWSFLAILSGMPEITTSGICWSVTSGY